LNRYQVDDDTATLGYFFRVPAFIKVFIRETAFPVNKRKPLLPPLNLVGALLRPAASDLGYK